MGTAFSSDGSLVAAFYSDDRELGYCAVWDAACGAEIAKKTFATDLDSRETNFVAFAPLADRQRLLLITGFGVRNDRKLKVTYASFVSLQNLGTLDEVACFEGLGQLVLAINV